MLLVAAVLLGAGLVAPAMTVQPAFGKFDSWVRLLEPDATRPTTYSLLGGIRALIDHGDVAIGLLLLGFSVIFPIVKLSLMSWSAARLEAGVAGGTALTLAQHSGKFSMLDVLVVAMLVLAIKGLPGGSTLTLRVGVWLFAASVGISLVVAILLHRREKQARTLTAPAE